MTRNAAIGGTLWFGMFAGARFGLLRLETIELLFLLGPLVIVPLGLELCSLCADEKEIKFLIRVARWVQLPAAVLVMISFLILPGRGGAALALPWLGFGCFAGACGFVSLIRGGYKSLQTSCMIASFVYLPVGCAWLVASRYGLTPMNFQEPIVLLTAVHFHFAGFAAPLLARATESFIQKKGIVARRIFGIVSAGVLTGPGMLAAGFIIGPRMKLMAAILVASSEIGLALIFLSVIRALRPRIAQVLIGVSMASILFAMILAAIWAVGEFPLQPFVHLDEMARFHGAANALGFTLCGLVGWTLAAQNDQATKENL
jgi:hypothetical protein